MNVLSKKSIIIAIDFDGTIVEDRYPKIGKPRIFAFETMKLLQQNGHRLILWTYRENEKLKEAVNFCKQQGIEFYAVNKSHPEEQKPYQTRKIAADYFVDDRNIQGVPDWGMVGQQLLNLDNTPKNNKESLFTRLFK